MFKFGKKEPKKPVPAKVSEPEAMVEKKGWFSRLSQGLSKTRKQLGSNLANVFLGKKVIDEELFEMLETQLLLADIGIDTSDRVLAELKERIDRKDIKDPDVLLAQLQEILTEILQPCEVPLVVEQKPFILLMVGVNGAGKTTSIAKIAHYYKQQGLRVMLAAGDTFRAAAIEQLQAWGARNDVPVIAQQNGADSASVIYDAITSAKAKDYDLVIADTAGRLHTQSHLMDELAKIKRVIHKLDETAPHETLLVLDATTGQNGLNQATQFNEHISLSGVCLTKLDGSAKGGIIYAIADKLKLPIRFIGVGEQAEDLKPFSAKEFSEAIFSTSTSAGEASVED